MSAVRQTIDSAKGTRVLLPFEFDWKRPDYRMVFAHRAQWYAELVETKRLDRLWDWYRTHNAIAQFICDWGCTFDPRNPEIDQPSLVPFILFPKQVEWIDWFMERWRGRTPGLTEKSRDCGVSWLAMCVTSTLCLWRHGLAFGFGSRIEKNIDESDNSDCLFFKARFFLNHLPPPFRRGWSEDRDSANLRIAFRETRGELVGQAGDEIGRGGRRSAYFVDEAAHLLHPKLIESSLLSNTNCRIDISSVRGMANPFARKRHEGKVSVFTFHWRDDPRKGQEWYDKLKADGTDPVALAQDVDINYAASSTGLLVPAEWFNAAVNACERLGIEPSGECRGGFDVADEGSDLCAFAARYGVELRFLEEWSGEGGDIFRSVERVMGRCDRLGVTTLVYDADGMGAGVRGDVRVVNEARRALGKPQVRDYPFHGSGAVSDPDAEFRVGAGETKTLLTPRTNRDYFANLKAQSWMSLRARFQATYRAVVLGLEYQADDIISISLPDSMVAALGMQVQQVLYTISGVGKVVIDKAPDGMKSPDLADAVMIAFNPSKYALEAWIGLTS